MTTTASHTYETPVPRIYVTDFEDKTHRFFSTGLDEDYTYTYNDYTGELTIERVAYGPRGTDEWARTSAEIGRAHV